MYGCLEMYGLVEIFRLYQTNKGDKAVYEEDNTITRQEKHCDRALNCRKWYCEAKA